MKHSFGNAGRTARFNAGVLRWVCLAILLLFGLFFIVPAVVTHPGAAVTASLLGAIIPGSRHGMRFLDKADEGTGGLSEEDKKKLFDGVKAMADKAKQLEEDLKKAASAEEFTQLKADFDKLVEASQKMRKAQLSLATRTAARKGEVGEDAARFIGALAIIAGLKGGQLAGDRVEGLAKEVLGEQFKTALTSGDIPLPTQYSGDVVELVSAYGAARKYGTVFPLGAGTVKLPQLTTDPTFGLIAQSASVTEKSPQVGWVTFTPEKFGGLVRLPSEMDEDSIIAIGQFVARYAARQLARVEDHNFFIGTGAGSGANGSVKGIAVSTIDNSKVVQQASTKTKTSDVTLANLRAIRAVVDAPAIGMGAYYMHPSMEQALSGLNTSGDKPYQANGLNGATLDGFPIRWVDVLPVYSTGAQASKVYVLFGDLSFQYLGVRGAIRMDTSKEAGFTTDEILIRALERFTIGLMAAGAVSGLQTAAS